MEHGSGGEHGGWKQKPETRDYRDTLARSLVLARAYDGSEAGYDQLMSQLVALENTILESASLQHEAPDARETAAALTFAPDHPRDIQDILDLAIASRNKALQRSLVSAGAGEEEKEDTGSTSTTDTTETEPKKEKKPAVLVVHVRGVLFPTEPSPPPSAAGPDRKKFEPARFQERLQDVLGILASLKVYADDMIVMIGDTDAAMIREESYTIVRVPRLNRTILVCDQVKEATFVVRGDVVPDDVLCRNKEAFVKERGADIRKIWRHNDEKWKSDITNLLSSDSIWDDPSGPPVPREPRAKVDVRSFRHEDIRARIATRVGSAEAWANIISTQRREFFIDNMGFTALAKLFGVEGNALGSTAPHLRFGLVIFPDNEFLRKRLEVEERTPEEWKKTIAAKYTPEQWLAMDSDTFKSVVIDGYSLHSIAEACGIAVGHYLTRPLFLRLGLMVFPKNEKIEKVLELAEGGLEKWREGIRKETSAEQWLAMTNFNERRVFKFGGKGLGSLGTLFGVGNAKDSLLAFLRLGYLIFPESQELRQKIQAQEKLEQQFAEVEKRSTEEWRTKIQAEYTPASWLALRRRDFQMDRFSIQLLGRKFGIAGDLLMDIPFLRLSHALFPNEATITAQLKQAEDNFSKTERRTTEEWRTALAAQTTPEQWVKMSSDSRRAFAVDGVKLIALSTLLGNEGNVLQNKADFLRMGLIIWPANPLITEKLAERNKKEFGKK